MITKVAVSGFKSLKAFEISLDPHATVLLGANNSGKSSLLEAIHIAVSAAQAVGLRGVPDWVDGAFESVLPAEALSSARVDVRNMIHVGASHCAVTLSTEDRECLITLTPTIDSVKIFIRGQLLAAQLMDRSRPFCIYVPGLAGIPIREAPLAEGVVTRAIARGDSNLVLRNVLALLNSETASWQAFVDDLRSVFKGADFEFPSDAKTDDVLRVLFRHGDGVALPLENAGTGVLQTIQLLAYTRLFEPRLLLLDEPDSHLHPSNQRRLCSLVLDVALQQDGAQAVIATHSRHVVSAMRNRAQVRWLQVGTSEPSADGDLIGALLELGALDDGERLAGRALKCLVLTEDAHQEIIEALLWASGFQRDETLVLSYRGCTNTAAVSALCQAFAERLPGARIIVHIDRDYNDATALDNIAAQIKERRALPFITDGTDAESYFLSASYFQRLGLEPEESRRVLQKAIEESRAESVRIMINKRLELALRRKRSGDPFPDAGRISAAAHEEFDADPATACHGKSALGFARRLLAANGINPHDFYSAGTIDPVGSLAALARNIWQEAIPTPPAQAVTGPTAVPQLPDSAPGPAPSP